MKIGLIDVDGHHNFPNIPLMKISAWHKSQGDSVEWYYPLLSGHMDKVYMSKVFSFTPDYEYHIDADYVYWGGSGYCIKNVGGREIYDASQDHDLPDEIEHIYPDYSLYGITDTAYGYLSRGCPRNCSFCHVAQKEGTKCRKVADLSEFWKDQKFIKLLDPNITACPAWKDLFGQLIDSKAWIDFTQGIDARLLTEEKAEMLSQMKVKTVHFAWDRYDDGQHILPKLKMFKEMTGWHRSKLIVYVLTNYDTTFEQDLERVYTLRDMGYSPDVRIYDKQSLPDGHPIRKLQRWVNAPMIFNKVSRFEDYKR